MVEGDAEDQYLKYLSSVSIHTINRTQGKRLYRVHITHVARIDKPTRLNEGHSATFRTMVIITQYVDK